MRRMSVWMAGCGCVALWLTGCASSTNEKRPVAGQEPSKKKGDSAPRVRTDGGKAPSAPTTRAVAYTPENNPTTRDGRGKPGLDNALAPAAWILVDGHEGRFTEREGNPQVQWVIEGSVGESPTFLVAALTSVMGNPTEFACTLDTIETEDGSIIAYAIKAHDGAFRMGKVYPLLHPGSDFVVRNRATGDVVDEIAPLAPGTYLLAAKIANAKSGKEALAVTQFTVR